ncbi:alpha/beta-hydrolase [Gymnopus androsaceus JB14]|uniref:Alpha/beta-hydrolase n=1 Tax=Gymnopus androsaceus JB14 TaxID=1447944 RepID=A0A6A4IAG7_9AGAR|nr:alpha/beta-hydrolase [Gymnopus androsaceus JB14]
MPFAQVKTASGNIKFHYIVSTPKADCAEEIDPNLPVVLWFHSLAFPHVFHSQFADPLLRKFNLVVFDLRSHGETQGEDLPEGYSIKNAADDALALMDTLQVPPCHFVAMDFGSPIALQIAVSHPHRVLSFFIMSQTCLEEPPAVREGHQQVYDSWSASFPGPDEVDKERMLETSYGFAQFMFSNNMTSLAQAMFNLTFLMGQKHWGYHGQNNYRIATIEFLLNRKAQPRTALSCLQCPVKLVYGTEDVAYPQKYTEDFLRDLEHAGVTTSLHVVPGAPHFVGVDYAHQVNHVLHDFIMHNENRKPPPVSSIVLSPWHEALQAVGWDPEGAHDSDSDDFVVTYPSRPH